MNEEPEVYAEDLADSVPLPSGMPHRTMPERIYAANVRGLRGHAEEYSFDGATEYIRADVANERIERLSIELEQTRKAEVEARYYDAYQMNEIESMQAIIKERDARIAELEAAQRNLCADVIFYFSEYAVYDEDEQAVIDKAREVFRQLSPQP